MSLSSQPHRMAPPSTAGTLGETCFLLVGILFTVNDFEHLLTWSRVIFTSFSFYDMSAHALCSFAIDRLVFSLISRRSLYI